MLTLSSTQSAYEGIIIFGGVNLKSYCKSRFYQFTLGNKKDSKKAQSNVASSNSLRLPESEAVSVSSRGQKWNPEKNIYSTQFLNNLQKSLGKRYAILHDNVRERIDMLKDICSSPRKKFE